MQRRISMKALKKRFIVFLVLAALAASLVPVLGSADLTAQAKSVSVAGYKLSKGDGTYQGSVKVKVTAKKGYKVYYSTTAKLVKKNVIKSQKSKTFTFNETTILRVYAVKNSKSVTANAFKKNAKKYKYIVETASEDSGSTDTGADTGSDVNPGADTGSGTDTGEAENVTYTLDFDSSAWKYDADNDVYYQIGVVYCTDPETTDYESMGIYVPGAYLNGTDNGDGTYTCTVNGSGEVNGFTAETAPLVIPVNTAGYSAQKAPTSYSYSTVSSYLSKGLIYVYAGCRGREKGSSYNGGAPWGVTDLKAAIRYVRYNDSLIPGDTEKIFTFGHSGGGAQSSLVGATGDSELYYTYLESIGAAMYDANGNYISDAIYGAQCWCPITCLDVANEAYEWMMGQYSSSGTRASTTWTSALSDDLAEEYAAYVNAAGFTDAEGNVLTLDETTDGIYAAGSYYDYLISTIEESLNTYIANGSYADSSYAGSSGGPGGAPGGAPMATATKADTYTTAESYIESLNSKYGSEWVTYDASTGKCTVTDLAGFVNTCKSPSKNVGAFDDLDRGQAENMLFGFGTSSGAYDYLHFDLTMKLLLEYNAEEYAAGYSDGAEAAAYAVEYASDLDLTDPFGISVYTRANMYNPIYYLDDYYDGYGHSAPAKYWRIRSGIEQGDTSLTTEMNLALALQAYDGVEDVDFLAVWGQGHTQADENGTSSATASFINWVIECSK